MNLGTKIKLLNNETPSRTGKEEIINLDQFEAVESRTNDGLNVKVNSRSGFVASNTHGMHFRLQYYLFHYAVDQYYQLNIYLLNIYADDKLHIFSCDILEADKSKTWLIDSIEEFIETLENLTCNFHATKYTAYQLVWQSGNCKNYYYGSVRPIVGEKVALLAAR